MTLAYDASRSSVISVGFKVPFSKLLTILCETPAMAAALIWLSPNARRSRLKLAPIDALISGGPPSRFRMLPNHLHTHA